MPFARQLGAFVRTGIRNPHTVAGGGLAFVAVLGGLLVFGCCAAALLPRSKEREADAAAKAEQQALARRLASLSPAENVFVARTLAGETLPELNLHALELGQWGTLGRTRILQVTGPDTCLVSDAGVLAKVAGEPTSRMVDGRAYQFGDAVFVVEGTTRYPTVDGATRQVLRIQRASTEEAQQVLEALQRIIAPRKGEPPTDA